jgi:short-subunit dehydrogenase
MNPTTARPLAIVTGASQGIGLELARCCAREGFDLVIAADRPLDAAAGELKGLGAEVAAVQADLATQPGIDRLLEAVGGRPVDALLANAGHGAGGAFLDQDFETIRHVLDTNVTGTLYLLHRVARGMRDRGRGRILITGSIAGVMPAPFEAVYGGTKAFVDMFAVALRNELKDTGVTVTVLMPGPTDTGFFTRAGMDDTRVGEGRKDDPADVARTGFEAMQKGEADVVAGLKNKLQAAAADVTPPTALAEMHRKLSEPGGARH